MKYIKTINEHFNEKFVEYYIEKLRLELEKLANGGYFYFSEDIKARKRFGYGPLKTFIVFNIHTDRFLVYSILEKYKNIFSKNGYILTYKFNILYELILKETKLIRVNPKKYIYHYSEEKSRDSILKNGLIPQKFDPIKWTDYELEYENDIFAINSSKNYKWEDNGKSEGKLNDCWQIDTTNLKNKWWEDLNMNSKNYIMTFEPIPPEFLKLV